MKIPSNILSHLITFVPFFTDLFSVLLNVLFVTVGGNPRQLRITVINHGLDVGDSVLITEGLLLNSIISIAAEGTSQVRFRTNEEHDLVSPNESRIDEPFTVRLIGFTDSNWNDTFDLQYVPNRRHFVIDYPSGVTTLPTLNGSEKLIEDRNLGIKGVNIIDTIVNQHSFTVAIPDNYPDLPTNNSVLNFKVLRNVRMANVTSIERAREIYTRQNPSAIWGFLIMGDVTTSKDRHTLNDATAGFTNQDLALLRFLQDFSFVVFIPTDTELTGTDAQDLAYREIFNALLNTLYAYTFNTIDSSDSLVNYLTICTGHGPISLNNTAWYEHAYEWQLPSVIDFESGFLQVQDVAFRDILLSLYNNRDINAELSININLDEEIL